MGFAFTVQAFIVIIVGGLGSLPGALVAAYAFGVVQSLATLWASSSVANVIGPLIMLAVLLIRPSGLFGKQVGRL
jgi:branched-chain amino acid transport system permease protein